MKKLHMVNHLERRCKCGATLSMRVHDYGLLTYPELDDQLGQNNIPVVKVKCPNCGIEEWPEYLVMYDITSGKMEPAIRSKIGSDGFPVVGGDTPYGVTLSPKEQAEYERGLEKKDSHYEAHKKEFWDRYCEFALERWPQMLRELTRKEYAAAYEEMGLPIPARNPSLAAWRRDTEKHLTDNDTRRLFWYIANRYLVEQEFVWTPIDTWPMAEWIREYGRERVAYITLHVPLPEELERWRTKAISLVVKKKSGETGVLFERIGQLGRDLDRQRNRSVELSRLLTEARQENAALAEQVGQLKKEITELRNRPPVVTRDPDDMRKIRALKGLVAELRAEVERLAVLVPADEVESYETPEEVEALEAPREKIDISVLAGKTILVAGWPREAVEADLCRVVWHHGDSVDVELQALAREADIYVVLTRYCSHAVMWWLKEAAIDRDVPVLFVRETNVGRIMEIMAEKIAARG
jgi:hypothetical protein